MSLKEIPIKREYRPEDNVVRNFYIPLLSSAISYQRAVGFFSSTILAEIAVGISALVRNNGKIQIVASPYLSDEDVEAIKMGYKARDEVVKDSILNALEDPKSDFEKENLNLLANLIADSVLDIKIAFTEKGHSFGMYHEKMGIISDAEGNRVAFSGSLNETFNAVHFNYETIDVYCSWKTEDVERVNDKISAFERIWNNDEANITIIDFPELKDEMIRKYKREKVDYEKFVEPKLPDIIDAPIKMEVLNRPTMPDWLDLHDYQESAIEEWAKRGYRGIFDMATGTGKTLTGLSAITKISKDLNNKLAVIVVAPYQHLVDQWCEDIEKFNIAPIIGYSSSPQRNWLDRLRNAIFDQNLGVKNSEFFLFVCTNATFGLERTQAQLAKIKGDVLLVIDEAHNAGSASFEKLLNPKYKYRLALSATLDRHGDEEGTQRLYDYFGEKCITYPLDQAIEAGWLTRYYYHPIVVTLEPDELEEYIGLSREIGKCIIWGRDGKKQLNERGKRLALARARIVSGARQKLSALRREIEPFKDDKFILVYCGATNVLPDDQDRSSTDENDIRQVEAVSSILGNELGMKSARFTSDEDMSERKIIKEQFSMGNLQALVAIKCLDEGVNIPAIRTAFILASTTNPKEYIQRRGRVLRLSKGKEYANIYDFITLPRPIDTAHYLTDDQAKMELSLIKSEIKRAEEFARISMNKMDAMKLIDSIKEAYSIDKYLLLDEEVL